MNIFKKKKSLLIFGFVLGLILVPVTFAIAPGGGGGEGGGSLVYYYIRGYVLDRNDDPVSGADVTVTGVYNEEKTDETDSNGFFLVTFGYTIGGLKSFIIEVTYSYWALERVVVSQYPGVYDPTIIHMGPNYYAVLVGMSNDDASKRCDKSILAWYNFLTEPEKMDFHQEDIRVYGSNEVGNDYPDGTLLAYEPAVKAGLSWLYATADADDVTVFVYCGHGDKDATGHYFDMLYYDDDENNDGHLYDYTLASYIQTSQAERIFCAIDCCYAGGFGPGIQNNPINGERTFTVTAADADTEARSADPDYDYTAFTRYFLVDNWDLKSNPDTFSLEDVYQSAALLMDNDPDVTYLPVDFDGNLDNCFSIRG